MFSEWSLEALGKIVTGKTPPKSIKNAYSDSGVPFVTPKDMDGRKWTVTTERSLSHEGVRSVQKSVVPAGSVAVSCIGSDMGKAVRIPVDSVTNQQINTLIPDTEKCDPDYLYYLLSTMQQDLKDIAGGSATPILNKGHFGKVRVRLPTIWYQKQAAKILSALDDKIQVNHQINQTLEQMAQAIFKSWFVDFEPVKAKIAALEAGGSEEDALLAAMQVIAGDAQGCANAAGDTTPGAAKGDKLTRLQAEQPEQYAELRATAELFPSAMQDSELGEIPEGWIYGTLSDLADFSSNRISKDELSLETYISTENMLENRKGVCTASSLPSSASVPSFESGEILISNIRPYFKKIWLANKSGGRSPDVLGFTCRHKGTNEYLFNLLYHDDFFEYMMLTSKGAKMPRGDKKAIMQFGSVIPPIGLMKYFSERVKPFYVLATSQTRESESLESLRDTLLPKLLSGELSVSNIEDQLAELEEPAHV